MPVNGSGTNEAVVKKPRQLGKQFTDCQVGGAISLVVSGSCIGRQKIVTERGE